MNNTRINKSKPRKNMKTSRKSIAFEKKELKQPNNWVRGQHYPSTIQSKTWKFLVYRALPTLTPGSIHEVPIHEIAMALNYKDTSQLKKDLKSMQNIKLDWSQVSPKYSGESIILPDVRYLEGQENVLTYSFSPLVVRDLIEPEQFELLNVNLILGFKSQYAIKIYEIASSYYHKKNHFGRTPYWNKERLRQIFNVPKNKYKKNYDFLNYVINIPLLEVNEKSNLRVKFFQNDRSPKFRDYWFEMKPNNDTIEALKLDKEKIMEPRKEVILRDIPNDEIPYFWEWLRQNRPLDELPERPDYTNPEYANVIISGLKYWPGERLDFIKNNSF